MSKRMPVGIIVVALLTPTCLAQQPAAAPQPAPAPAAKQEATGPAAFSPGLQVRLYEMDQSVGALPDLVDDQAPNVVKVVPVLDLDTERNGDTGKDDAYKGDFGGLKSDFLTEVVGVLWIQQAGEYTFRLISDDGSKLWIDGRLVADNDGSHPAEPKDGKINLTATAHELKILHFQGGGGGSLKLEWNPAGANSVGFSALPVAALGHKTKPEIATAPGKKKVIAPLRRGRPGDGTPVAGAHPGFGKQTGKIHVETKIVAGVVPLASDVRPKKVVLWLPGASDNYEPAGLERKGLVTLGGKSYENQFVCVGANEHESVRVTFDPPDKESQGAVFRFSSAPDHALEPAGKPVFELLTVTALKNGFELQFTKPLDPRCGWEPDSYYIEQWPFDVKAGKAPHRDGVVYPVKYANVSADRTKVFVEIENLKPSHVVYLRLLPPCISADGELPWSTEAWYTLNTIPQDRQGEVLQRPTPPSQNVLTDQEKKDGWRLLFDGQTSKGWHGFGNKPFPAGWQIRDGCLAFDPARKLPGGDIVTDDEFADFELSIEWRVTNGSNSGIMYRVGEDQDAPWRTGPEYQILDNAEHPDGRNVKTSAASCYALYAPVKDATNPVGLFNQGKIVCKGNHVEHWLNGVKVVEYELNSPEWNKLVAESKFNTMPLFGKNAKGRIDLQDHGDRVWYRNIKIREIK